MTGVVRSIPSKEGRQRNFAFIKGDDNKEYFLHASDLIGKWDKLKATIAIKTEAKVEFEFEHTDKGLKALHVFIID